MGGEGIGLGERMIDPSECSMVHDAIPNVNSYSDRDLSQNFVSILRQIEDKNLDQCYDSHGIAIATVY